MGRRVAVLGASCDYGPTEVALPLKVPTRRVAEALQFAPDFRLQHPEEEGIHGLYGRDACVPNTVRAAADFTSRKNKIRRQYQEKKDHRVTTKSP